MIHEIDLRPACITGPVCQIKDVLQRVAQENASSVQADMVAESFYRAAKQLHLATGASDFSMTLKLSGGRSVEMHFTA